MGQTWNRLGGALSLTGTGCMRTKINKIIKFDEIVKATKEFYIEPTNNRVAVVRRSCRAEWRFKFRVALQYMFRGKAVGQGGMRVNLTNYSRDIVLWKLDTLCTKCLMIWNLPDTWKDVSIILILQKKKDLKEVTSYRPISLLLKMYKIFTKMISNSARGILHLIRAEYRLALREVFSDAIKIL